MKFSSPEVFAESLGAGMSKGMPGRFGNLFWANGIVFRHFPYAQTDSISKQHLLGHLPIDHIEYAIMPDFKSEIQVGMISVTVVDVSNHSFFKDFTKWIKQKLDKAK